ncbi:MAG TPA: ABC transporter permease [Bryobacteraceae bacterium]|nr:ABC transporter permease [Bryobacteraceae bacterium]
MAIPGVHFVRNLARSRTLLAQLVRRDFQQRFVGSAAGWLWGLIHPLVLLVSWVFVFQICLHQTLPPNEVTQNYSLFLFCGFLPWLLFQETVTRSASSLLDNANLITKTVFPSEIVPISIFLSSLVGHLMVLALVIAVVGLYVGHFSLWMLSLPVYMLLAGMLAVGIGWIVASLQVYLRDTAQVLSVLLTFWFWLTPIFITEQQIPQQVRFIVRLNPLAFLVSAYRERLLSYRIPSLHDFAIIAAYAVTAFVLGGLFFRHLKRGFADVL